MWWKNGSIEKFLTKGEKAAKNLLDEVNNKTSEEIFKYIDEWEKERCKQKFNECLAEIKDSFKIDWLPVNIRYENDKWIFENLFVYDDHIWINTSSKLNFWLWNDGRLNCSKDLSYIVSDNKGNLHVENQKFEYIAIGYSNFKSVFDDFMKHKEKCEVVKL